MIVTVYQPDGYLFIPYLLHFKVLKMLRTQSCDNVCQILVIYSFPPSSNIYIPGYLSFHAY